MSSERPRHWKNAYQKDFTETPPPLAREDLSVPQKHWIKRAWLWASTALLGFKEPAIPDAIPRYNEKGGWFHVPAVEPHLHHTKPVGYSNRVLGEDYAQPENIVPLSARLHVGKGVRDNDEDVDRVIHEDTRKAFGLFRRNPKAFHQMSQEREEATRRGEAYHNTENDTYFEDLSRRVVDGYRRSHPDDEYPKTRKERRGSKNKKVWSDELMRWVDNT